MADQFTAGKLAWIEQVSTDHSLSPLTRVIATILATKYLNRETGEAWPAIETLAADVGLRSTNPVRAALRTLEQAGHISVQWSTGGKGHTSRIRPRLKTRKPFVDMKGNAPVKPFIGMNGNDAANPSQPDSQTLHGDDGKPFTGMNGNDAANPSQPDSQTLHGDDGKPFTGMKGNPLKEPIEEPRAGLQPAPRGYSTSKGTDRRALERAPLYQRGDYIDHPDHGRCAIDMVRPDHLLVRDMNDVEHRVGFDRNGEVSDAPF